MKDLFMKAALAAIILAGRAAGGPVPAAAQPLAGGEYCGAPLASARAAAFTLGLSTAVPADKGFRLLEIESAARVDQLELLLEPFAKDEKKIMKRIARRPPYLVVRVKMDKLRSIFSVGALLSPGRAYATGALKEKPFTPPIEDSLFGGHSCVFASYGPYSGRERYGDVVFRLAPEKIAGGVWASRASGWHFLEDARGVDPRSRDSVSADEIAAFADTVFAGRDLPRVFRLMTVAFLRARPAGERDRLVDELLRAPYGPAFYAIIDSERLGYLEAKIDGSVPLSAVTAIEVPPSALRAVLAWPEAEPYRKFISPATDWSSRLN
ncbi:MAG TPA: hypothetical protein PK523_10375 [Elusimicrobiales bacterium]|nr:hypothetical protein [Elusimicrobiales bacterium]